MKEATEKEKFIWNMLGSISNAMSTVILSISVNRLLDESSGGMFSFAYSNAQLMLVIGGFEVRPYQSTDIEEKYKFNTYFTFRILSCLLMLVASTMYVLIGDFDYTKSMVLILLSLFKMVEAFSDLYGGRFQQRDRIDLSGKTFFVRVVVSTIAFILLVATTRSLVIASGGMFIVSFALFFVYDYRFIFEEDKKNLRIYFDGMGGLFKNVLPLFIGNFLMMYISNAPKYAIDNYYGNEVQNVYNILFMPAFVINLFSIFIFRPMLITMTIDWKEKRLKKLSSMIAKIYGAIGVITLVVSICAWLLGIPVLSLLYNLNLSEYRNNLMLVMLAGGVAAVVTFAYYIITILRQQKWILIGYIVAFVYAFFVSNVFVKQFAIKGAIISYGSAVALLAVIFTAVIIISIRREKRLLGKKELEEEKGEK